MLFGPLFDELGRKLCRNTLDIDQFTTVEINQPQFPTLVFKKSPNFEQIKEFRKLLELRYKKKKKVEGRRPTVAGYAINPLRAAAVSSDLSGIKEWAKSYSINARSGYGEPSILIDAVKANASIDAIKLIIQLGAFINAVDESNRTALHHACQIGSFDIINLLLSKGAHYYLRDLLGRTPFHIVSALNSTECLLLVLQYSKGSDEINYGDNEGLTPLHWAAAKNHTEHLDIMLSKKYSLDLKRTDIELYISPSLTFRKTALHWCANQTLDIEKYAQSSAFKILNACNWDILNYKDIDGRTALHLACGENNMGLVQLLISHPTCDINAQDDMKRTALHWASVAGYSHIVQVLLRYDANDALSDVTKATALHYAASKNHIQCVVNLTEGRNYAYLPDADGRTPIVWAILKGHIQTLRVLLDKGADTESRDFQKCTPLHAAASSGNTMCASLLLQSGCQIDSLDMFSRTALFKTIENGHAETAALLLQKGASCSISDEDGRTPIHFAALFGRLNVLSLLLANGANPNATDLTGKTPLHCAAYNGNLDAIKFLIKSFANLNIRDLDGITALHWACGAGQPLSVELLLALGANPNMIDFSPGVEHSTPLDYAYSVGSYESAQLVKKFGGLEAKDLINKSGTIIAKFWRQYKKRTSSSHLGIKYGRENRRGSMMRRMSNVLVPELIIEVMHDSIEFSQTDLTESQGETSESRLPAASNINMNRRHSAVGLVAKRRNSFIDPNLYSEDRGSEKSSAASKIQRAWKRHCWKTETKFLIQLMGPEEASLMVERLIIREREKEMLKHIHERPRRKSRRPSDASKLLYEFPSKISVESRRSSFSFARAESNGVMQPGSSAEATETGSFVRRNSFVGDSAPVGGLSIVIDDSGPFGRRNSIGNGIVKPSNEFSSSVDPTTLVRRNSIFADSGPIERQNTVPSDSRGIGRRGSTMGESGSLGRRNSIIDAKPQRRNSTWTYDSNSSSQTESGLSKTQNSLKVGVLSRSPTIYKITMSDDELAYFAMERERNLLDESS